MKIPGSFGVIHDMIFELMKLQLIVTNNLYLEKRSLSIIYIPTLLVGCEDPLIDLALTQISQTMVLAKKTLVYSN